MNLNQGLSSENKEERRLQRYKTGWSGWSAGLGRSVRKRRRLRTIANLGFASSQVIGRDVHRDGEGIS